MRTQIEVTGMSPGQAHYIRTQVPVDGRDFLPGLPKVCAVFQLEQDVEFHADMDVIEFTGIMSNLATIEVRETATAVLTPDSPALRLVDGGRPVLPTADQVRNLSAADAAQLAREMNS